MANLFWRTPRGTKSLFATPFKSEDEFEKVVFQTSELLEDIFLLKRQIRGGGKSGIPDIIGIDSGGNVCIIEMKNGPVDSSIIPQVLQYAFWAETNPDSIKSLWLECKDRLDEITVAWDDLQVRILVIAPSVLRSTLHLADKINYQIDFIEVKRWVEGRDELLLVNRLEIEEPKTKVRPAAGQPAYNAKFYRSQYNSKSAEQFMHYAHELKEYVEKKRWPLEIKYNKYYCGFKAGFFNAFGIKWIGSKTFAFFFKLSEGEAKKLGVPMTRYENLWSEAIYYIDPSKTKIKTFGQLFEAAYKKITGD